MPKGVRYRGYADKEDGMKATGMVMGLVIMVAAGAAWTVESKTDGAPAGKVTAADTQKTADIVKLVHRMSGKQLKGMMDGMIKAMQDNVRRQEPDLALSDSVFEGLITEDDIEVLMDKMVPIYDKHFTGGEIKAVLAFYESPAGEKLNAEMPVMMQEIVMVAMDWAKQFEPRMKQRIEDAKAKKEKEKGGKPKKAKTE